MREDLAASLENISSRAAAVLPGDVSMVAACRNIRSHRIGTGVFTAYYDLVHALQAHDWARAADMWRMIAAGAAEAAHEVECRPYDPATESGERLQRLFARGWENPQIFTAPDEGDWRRFRGNVTEALGLLEVVSPPWRSELEGLLTCIYAAVPPDGEGRRFAGSSSFMAWGTVFLNARVNNDRLKVLSGLAHEATHLMLFGLSRRQPLTKNPPGQRYSSPLRSDPRPMDGVYHATYVSARLGLLYGLLSRHHGLTDEERHAAAHRVERQRQRFDQGYDVIRREGVLSALGRELIEEAADSVAGALA